MYNKIKYKKTLMMSTFLMVFSHSVFAQEAPVVGQSGNPFAKSPPPSPKQNINQPQVNQPLTPEQEEAVRQIVLNLSPGLIQQSSQDMINGDIKDPYTLYLEENESIRGTLNGKYMIFNSMTNDYRYELISKYKNVSLYQTDNSQVDSQNTQAKQKTNKG